MMRNRYGVMVLLGLLLIPLLLAGSDSSESSVVSAASPAAASHSFSHSLASPSFPQRIMSLNACSDQLLLMLVPRERIVALTFLATNPFVSALWRDAHGIAQVRGSAEEVLTLQPDFVLAGQFTARHTVRLLKQFGIPVQVLPPVEDFRTMRDQIRQVAQVLGETARGEAVIAELDHQLAQWTEVPTRIGAFYRQGGYTAGRQTLTDAVMQAAQMTNVAALAGIQGSGYLPLERLLIARPDWLITSDYQRDVPTLGMKLLRHPALQGLPGGERILPGNLTACGGPWTSQAVRLLADLPIPR